MTPRHLILAGAIALALSACGKSPAPAAEAPAPAPAPAPTEQPAPVEAEAIPATEAPVEATPVETTPAQTAPAAAATGSKPAVIANCATTIESNDAMQYDVDSITVPASCSTFTIHLKHVGKMPVTAMGHNVVVAKEADMRPIAVDGMTITPEHLKPDDARVIAHTAMIGGGGSTSVTFDVAKVRDGGPYVFFCSFPGHMGLMQGSLQVQ